MFISKEEKLETKRRIEAIEQKLSDLLTAIDTSEIKTQINYLRQSTGNLKHSTDVLHVGLGELTQRMNHLFTEKKIIERSKQDGSKAKKLDELTELTRLKIEIRLAKNREYARKYYRRKQAEKRAALAAQLEQAA